MVEKVLEDASYQVQLKNPSEVQTPEQIDLEIVALDNLMLRIQNRRAEFCRARNQSALISSCLPAELIAEIFLFALAMSPSQVPSSSVATTLPLVLGQVCSAWRNLAWELSELWDTFHCRISKGRCPAQARLLSEWLLRSHERPLSIRLSFLDDEFHWNDLGAPIDIVNVLNRHRHRWLALDLVLAPSWYEPLRMETTLDTLISLSLRPTASAFSAQRMDMFLLAHQLREISLSHHYLRNVHLNWDNLIKISFSTASVDEAVELIRRCNNLVTCILDELYPFEDEYALPLTPFSHRRIEVFHIGCRVNLDTEIFIILNCLALPSLRNLSIMLPEQVGNPLQTIGELITRSECPIQKLRIHGHTLLEQDMIDFLQSVKSLKSIEN